MTGPQLALAMLAGVLLGVGMVMMVFGQRVRVSAKRWDVDLSQYPDEEEAAHPLRVLDDPMVAPQWETVGYLTVREEVQARHFQFWIESCERTLEMATNFRAPRGYVEELVKLRGNLRMASSKWWDTVIVRRGWNLQHNHDSEYALTHQYRTIRRAPPAEWNKPISELKVQSQPKVH